MTIKFYFAGRYGRRKELLEYAEALRCAGHEVTSRWLNGEHEMHDEKPSHDQAKMFAMDDLQDIHRADILVAFTESPGDANGRARGGRHVELGYALARGMYVIVVGHRENVFCHLERIEHYKTPEEFLREYANQEALHA